MASIDPIDLCNEAKVERCRATRDLRSCGRNVQRILNPCGHAALCDECSQRCEVCPICRMSLPKGGNELPLRLYYECIEAGLISKRFDDRLRDKEDTANQLVADVQRLYSLFDVTLENNLVSLICHCILQCYICVFFYCCMCILFCARASFLPPPINITETNICPRLPSGCASTRYCSRCSIIFLEVLSLWALQTKVFHVHFIMDTNNLGFLSS